MLISKEPYFMKNKDWYYYDLKTGRYKLTDKAPKKAIDSYNEYYELFEKANTSIRKEYESDLKKIWRNK